VPEALRPEPVRVFLQFCVGVDPEALPELAPDAHDNLVAYARALVKSGWLKEGSDGK
jgi:hypothetical protein